MNENSANETPRVASKYRSLSLDDFQNVSLTDFVEFFQRALGARDNDVLQLGDHLLLVANSEQVESPCCDCAFGGDRRLCRFVPCTGLALSVGYDVRYLAILSEGGEHVRK